jgi:hypothetical protein
MKAQRGSGGLAPARLNLGTRWSVVVKFRQLYPWERTPLSIGVEAGWALKPVWTFWKGRNLLLPPRFELLYVQHVVAIAIPTATSRPFLQGRIILKYTKKCNVSMWTGLNWFRIVPSLIKRGTTPPLPICLYGVVLN